MSKGGGACQFFGGRMTSLEQGGGGVIVNVFTPTFRKSCIRACMYNSLFLLSKITRDRGTRVKSGTPIDRCGGGGGFR